MKEQLRDEFAELIKDRQVWATTTLSISLPTIISVVLSIRGNPGILIFGFYTLLLLFLTSNSIYVLGAKRKETGFYSLDNGKPEERSVPKYSLLRPYAQVGLLFSGILIIVFFAVPPFNRPTIETIWGTPTSTPMPTSAPTQTPPQIPTGTSSPVITSTIITSTPTFTSIPRANKLYYVFIVDASSRMSARFDSNKTKWDSVREVALEHLIFGLPSRANFGLIILGGSSSNNSSACDSVVMSPPLGPDSRDTVEAILENRKTGGDAPLAQAIELARDELLDLSDDSTVRGLELFVFLGGGDSCLGNGMKPLSRFLEDSAKYLTNTHIDVFILSDEVDSEAMNEIETSSHGVENVRVRVTRNTQDLESAVDQSFLESKERGREIEPSAIAAQETMVGDDGIRTATKSATASATNPSPPTYTASLTPSRTPGLVMTTPVPTTEHPTLTDLPTLISTATLPPIVWTPLPSQTDVFSQGCPLIEDARLFAQSYRPSASISAELRNSGHSGNGLRINFSEVSDMGERWVAWEVWLGNDDEHGIDLSAYSSLEFYIRGNVGGERPNVWLMTPKPENDYERFWKAVADVTEVTTAWQQVVIPLHDFTLGQKPHEHVDLRNIMKIQIVFEWFEQPTSGRIFVDDLCVR